MRVYYGYEGFEGGGVPSAVTLGCFDGVHVGHREIIARVCGRRGAVCGSAGLVTFDPPPEAALGRPMGSSLLTLTDEKLRILESLGLDWVVVIGCDEGFMGMGADEFLCDVLLGRLGVVEVVVGHDVGFGRGREGDEDFLRRMSVERGFGLEVVEAVEVGGRVVSSTAVRAAVRGGDFDGAALMLGRRFSFGGEVVRGRQLGGKIGFPTANVCVHEHRLAVSDGVYAVRVEFGGVERGGVMSVGVRPTVEDGGARTYEVNVFDFEGDLYGVRMEVFPVRFLRAEMKFSGVEELRGRIAEDVVEARRALQ